MIDFELTEEQREFQQLARDFATNEIRPVASHYDKTGDFPMDIMRKGWEIGLMNATIPENYGGVGIGALEAVLISEEISWGCAGIGTSLMCNGLALEPLLTGATEEQKKKFLIPFAHDFNMASFCLTERGAGSDAGSLATQAIRKGDEYIINGSKCFITNGGYASFFTVFAVTDKERGARGLSTFWVPRDSKGITIGKHEDKMGQRSSNTAEIFFDDVVVPKDNLIGREGMGFVYAMKTLDKTRPIVGAASVGIAQAAFEYSLEYAKTRVQFGGPIARNQAISFMLADMKQDIEAARLLVWKAAWMSDRKMKNSEISALCKTFASDVAMRVTTNSVQIHGGYGYTKDYPVEKLMRDAKLMQIYEGTNQIQRLVASREILAPK
ncbi:MAG: acyl-CoA dehydrogenase family protein [Acidobacteriota bacterium]